MGTVSSHVLATRKEKVLVTGYINSFALAPDGRQIAAADREKILLVPTNGGPPKTLLELKRPPWVLSLTWSPDGRTIWFAMANTGPQPDTTELWSVPTNGDKPRRVGLAINASMLNLRIQPRNNRIAFVERKLKYEIWALENFLP
jgi:dipeptidyl aminopeptidase/acylaminoacyl peptidase